MKPKKGDRLRYTGFMVPGCPRYPAGVVVAFRTNRGVKCVTVRLDAVQESYADWPVAEVEAA